MAVTEAGEEGLPHPPLPQSGHPGLSPQALLPVPSLGPRQPGYEDEMTAPFRPGGQVTLGSHLCSGQCGHVQDDVSPQVLAGVGHTVS